MKLKRFINDEYEDATEYESFDALLQVDFMLALSNDPKFNYFAISSDNKIIAVADNGLEWTIIGQVACNTKVPLQRWDKGYYKIDVDGIEKIISGLKVKSIDGNEITLKDGSKYSLI